VLNDDKDDDASSSSHSAGICHLTVEFNAPPPYKVEVIWEAIYPASHVADSNTNKPTHGSFKVHATEKRLKAATCATTEIIRPV